MVFEKEYIMRCSSAEWIARNGCALRWCHRGVGRSTEETVGFPEWTAQFCVWKTTGKDSPEACAFACQTCAVYSVFPSGMTSHSKIAQFNWECIGRFSFILTLPVLCNSRKKKNFNISFELSLQRSTCNFVYLPVKLTRINRRDANKRSRTPVTIAGQENRYFKRGCKCSLTRMDARRIQNE